MKNTKSPWQKIIIAAKRGRGLRLTSDEVFALSMDDAIETVASNDDMADEERRDAARATKKANQK